MVDPVHSSATCQVRKCPTLAAADHRNHGELVMASGSPVEVHVHHRGVGAEVGQHLVRADADSAGLGLGGLLSRLCAGCILLRLPGGHPRPRRTAHRLRARAEHAERQADTHHDELAQLRAREQSRHRNHQQDALTHQASHPAVMQVTARTQSSRSGWLWPACISPIWAVARSPCQIRRGPESSGLIAGPGDALLFAPARAKACVPRRLRERLGGGALKRTESSHTAEVDTRSSSARLRARQAASSVMIVAATVDGCGIGWPSSRRPSRWNSMARRISSRASA